MTSETAELEKVLLDVTASLVAAISVLKRAEGMKSRPSIAVASGRTFAQMIEDYEVSAHRARLLLVKEQP